MRLSISKARAVIRVKLTGVLVLKTPKACNLVISVCKQSVSHKMLTMSSTRCPSAHYCLSVSMPIKQAHVLAMGSVLCLH